MFSYSSATPSIESDLPNDLDLLLTELSDDWEFDLERDFDLKQVPDLDFDSEPTDDLEGDCDLDLLLLNLSDARLPLLELEKIVKMFNVFQEATVDYYSQPLQRNY